MQTVYAPGQQGKVQTSQETGFGGGVGGLLTARLWAMVVRHCLNSGHSGKQEGHGFNRQTPETLFGGRVFVDYGYRLGNVRWILNVDAKGPFSLCGGALGPERVPL